MSERPTGTVTFLLTDIEGSTRLWEQHPEAMKAAVARHDVILRSAVEGQGGYVVKTTGDGVLAAFCTAHDALAAARLAQQALFTETWGELGVLKARFGLHTGPAEERQGDYFGPTLNRTARLMAAGHGGQVLLSQATYELVRDYLRHADLTGCGEVPTGGNLSGLSLRDLGERRLKDLTRPEHIYQLIAPGLPTDFPPLKTLDARQNNLPAQPAPLIGRETELRVARDLLLRPDVRLVTLTGPGGTGKTRLALQVGADLLDEFQDGVYFVEVAPITDANLVPAAIAQTLGVREQSSHALLDSVKDYLKEKLLLLILDNFEHLVSAATVVAELLRAAPRLKVLVTSRVVLRLRGEQEFAVPPLAVPNLQHLPPLAALSQYAAVEMFIQRAINVRPDFAVTNENAPAVAAICHRLDGLPLAIELAAARIRLLSPQAILERLDNRLKLLTGGPRDMPPRHQTLRAAIDWSYGLLDEGEKTFFRRLAIFVGGFSLAAAEALGHRAGDLDVDVTEAVEALIAKSLVRPVEVRGGEPRFTMLETIRDYGVEKQKACGEHGELEQWHAEYFAHLAFTAETRMRGPELLVWLDRLDPELANLRTAFSWAVNQGKATMALQLAADLFWFWTRRGYLREGQRWLSTALALDGADVDPQVRAWALVTSGGLAGFLGQTKTARVYLEEAVSLFRTQKDTWRLAFALQWLAFVAEWEGDRDIVDAMLSESGRLFRQTDDPWAISSETGMLGYIEFWRGDYGAARTHLEASYPLVRAVGDCWLLATTANLLGDVARLQDDYERATASYTESLAGYRSLGHRMNEAAMLHNLARIACATGDYPHAATLFAECITLHKEYGDTGGLLEGLAGAASLQLGRGDLEKATRLLAAVDALRRTTTHVLWPTEHQDFERDLARVRAQIDAPTFEAAWNAGQKMTLEQAVAYALEELK